MLRGDGTGALGARVDYSVPYDARRLAVGDLNGDARLDIAVDREVVRRLRDRHRPGDGTFIPEQRQSSVSSVTGLVAADMDDDGDLDRRRQRLGCRRNPAQHRRARVLAAWPEPYSTGAPPDTGLAAVFSAAINRATLDSASFKAFGSMTGAHFGATSWDSLAFTARLDPRADFAPGEAVTALLTSRIRSAGGAAARRLRLDLHDRRVRQRQRRVRRRYRSIPRGPRYAAPGPPTSTAMATSTSRLRPTSRPGSPISTMTARAGSPPRCTPALPVTRYRSMARTSTRTQTSTSPCSTTSPAVRTSKSCATTARATSRSRQTTRPRYSGRMSRALTSTPTATSTSCCPTAGARRKRPGDDQRRQRQFHRAGQLLGRLGRARLRHA